MLVKTYSPFPLALSTPLSCTILQIEDGFEHVNLDDVMRCDNRVFRPGRRAYGKCSRCNAPRWVVISKDREVIASTKKSKTLSKKMPKPSTSSIRFRRKILLTRSTCACDKTAKEKEKEKAAAKDLRASPGSKRRGAVPGRAIRSAYTTSPSESLTRSAGNGRRRLYQSKSVPAGGDDLVHAQKSLPPVASSLKVSVTAAETNPGKEPEVEAKTSPMPLDVSVASSTARSPGASMSTNVTTDEATIPLDNTSAADDQGPASYSSCGSHSQQTSVVEASRRNRQSLSSCSDHASFSMDLSDAENEPVEGGPLDSSACGDDSGTIVEDGSGMFDDISIGGDDEAGFETPHSNVASVDRCHSLDASVVSCLSNAISPALSPAHASQASFDDLDGSTLTPRCGKRRRSLSPHDCARSTPTHSGKRRCTSREPSPLCPTSETSEKGLLRTPQHSHRVSLLDVTPDQAQTLGASNGPLACSTPSSGSNRSAVSPQATPLSRPRTRSCSRRAQLSFLEDPAADGSFLESASVPQSPLLPVLVAPASAEPVLGESPTALDPSTSESKKAACTAEQLMPSAPEVPSPKIGTAQTKEFPIAVASSTSEHSPMSAHSGEGENLPVVDHLNWQVLAGAGQVNPNQSEGGTSPELSTSPCSSVVRDTACPVVDVAPYSTSDKNESTSEDPVGSINVLSAEECLEVKATTSSKDEVPSSAVLSGSPSVNVAFDEASLAEGTESSVASAAPSSTAGGDEGSKWAK